MINYKSLYLRMTLIHLTGIILLPINAIFFTEEYFAQIVSNCNCYSTYIS